MSQLSSQTIEELKGRSREVFRILVENYLSTGEPIGSRTLSRSLSEGVSAATIRNVMSDLEHLGLLESPHVSAGRVPSQLGLRLFVDGMLEVGDIQSTEKREIESSLDRVDSLGDVLDQASALLSGLTQGAGVVMAPKSESAIKHIEFVSLAPDRAMVILVTEDGQVENPMFTPPIGLPASAMREAANFLNAMIGGRTLSELKSVIEHQLQQHQSELDILSQKLIKQGFAVWADEQAENSRLIVRGRSNLIDSEVEEADLERVKTLFDDLERKREIANFLDLAQDGEGVKIFIGSENKLFSLSGSSLVVSPYMDADRKIIGAVGVIGPTRLNYGRVVPIVDYTAQLVGRILRS